MGYTYGGGVGGKNLNLYLTPYTQNNSEWNILIL